MFGRRDRDNSRRAEGEAGHEAQSANRRVADWLAERLDQLVNVEVNTILARGGMTGRKMPPWPEVLHQVAADYAAFLGEFDIGAAGPPVIRRDVFDRLSGKAEAIIDSMPEADRRDRPNIAVLFRIKRHAQILDGLLDLMVRKEPGPEWKGCAAYVWDEADAEEMGKRQIHVGPCPQLPVEWATTLRKIWELGVNDIVLQTVFQLDGDIVNRIDPDRATDRQMALLRQMHDGATARSFDYWRMVFDLVSNLVNPRR